MKNKELENQRVREMFVEYYESNFKPNMKAICKSIGIDFNDFYKWRNGNHNYGEKNLTKIEMFIERVDKL